MQTLQKLISREPGDAAQIWFYVFLRVIEHCIDWRSKIVATKQSKSVKNPQTEKRRKTGPYALIPDTKLHADFLHFWTASEQQCYCANPCSVQLPVEKHRPRFGLRRLVLEISIFKVSAQQVSDVIAFCPVSLPSTVCMMNECW